jgi:hypothetical protein
MSEPNDTQTKEGHNTMSVLTTMSQRKSRKEPPRSHLKRTLFGGVATAALVFGVATAASASLPKGTTVTGALKSGTTMTFKGDIDSIPITVSCTSFSASGTVTKAKTTLPLSAPPAIKGCTDSSGGTDTVTTSGKWKITIAAKTMTLDAPKAGATFKSSILSACTITAFPSAAGKVAGAYNGSNTDKVTNASIPTKGTGCTSTAAKTTATVVLSPAPGAPPW